MSKEMGVVVLGLWVLVVPYLGVPSGWRTFLLVLSGIAVSILGFLLRGESLSRGVHKTEHLPFVESSNSAMDGQLGE